MLGEEPGGPGGGGGGGINGFATRLCLVTFILSKMNYDAWFDSYTLLVLLVNLNLLIL